MRLFLIGAMLFMALVGHVQAQHGIDVRVPNETLLIAELPDTDPGQVSAVRVFPRVAWPEHEVALQILQPPGDPKRFFVVFLSGKVITFPNVADPAPADVVTFLNWEQRVCRSLESGFLSIAFDPNFQTNGRLYVFYNPQLGACSELNPAPSRLSRLTMANPNSTTLEEFQEEVLIELPQLTGYHKGGQIAFGPDGMLYASFGDSATRIHAQNTINLYGSIIRIDVTSPPDVGLPYRIPPDNPFVAGGPGGELTRKEIFAYGFRNPWRWSFDPLSGNLYVGDVGDDTYEELNLVESGKNYGWPIFEGFACNSDPISCFDSGFEFPVAGYDHRPGNEAIIAGHTYLSANFPALYGVHIFADLDGDIWGARALASGSTEQFLISPGVGFMLAGMGVDHAGEVYLLKTLWPEPGIFVLRPAVPTTGSDFPTRLSDLPALLSAAKGEGHLVPGVIPFEPSAKLWSDNALKERYIALPATEQIGYTPTGGWNFPENSILIKNFVMPLDDEETSPALKRLETRLLFRKNHQWHGFSYEWNDEGTDASLLTTSKSKPYTVTTNGVEETHKWYFPNRNDCMTCHTGIQNTVLGLNTAQMNYDFSFLDSGIVDNQLRAYDYVSIFSEPIGVDPQELPRMPDYLDGRKDLTQRVQAYLASNCVSCHQPGGGAPVNLDFRWETPLEEMQIIGLPPTRGDFGIDDAQIVSPGSPTKSILLERIRTTNPLQRMPPLGTSRVDPHAVALLTEWIDSMVPQVLEQSGGWMLY